MLNLDKNLNKVGSLITRPNAQTGYEFDTLSDRSMVRSFHIKDASINSAKIEDASITSAKIQSFSFNQGTGGTLTMGGTANGNGVLLVKDEGGTTKITADNTGITITDGKLTFLNSSGSTAVDSLGVVSTQNFSFGQGTAGTANQDITSFGTTWTNVTGGSVTIDLARTANVLINYSVTARHNDFDGLAIFRLFDGTTVYGQNILIKGDADYDAASTHSASFIQNLAQGTYTVRMQGKQNNNPGTATLTCEGLANTPAVINYLVLGK